MPPAALRERRTTPHRRRELAAAVGIALAAHVGLFTAMLWRKIEVTAEDRAVVVELLPIPKALPPPEPPRAERPPAPARPDLPPVRMVEPQPTAPQVAPFETPAPRAPAPARDTDALAKSVLPGQAVDCGWPGLSAAERANCSRGRSFGRGDDNRFQLPPGKGERIPKFAMDRESEVRFDAQVDARKAEPSPFTATSRCDGWASDNAQRNLGSGCFATSRPEGAGATRPKSKYVQPRGTPFQPGARPQE